VHLGPGMRIGFGGTVMSRKAFFATILAPLLFWALISSPPLAAQDSEALGRAAEQAGRLREAVNHYVAAKGRVA